MAGVRWFAQEFYDNATRFTGVTARYVSQAAGACLKLFISFLARLLSPRAIVNIRYYLARATSSAWRAFSRVTRTSDL